MDSLMKNMIDDSTLISDEYLEYAKENEIVSNSQAVEGSTFNQTIMTYTLRPQENNFTRLNDYVNAGAEVDYCALIEYYVQPLYEFEIIDIRKSLIYIGWYSELFCDYYIGNSGKSYYTRSPSSTSRVAYDFVNNRTIYYPSLRSWYDKGTKENGLTTFVSTYVFADAGSIGATISKAFKDGGGSMKGVLSYDILPYTAAADKNTLIRKLFFDPETTDNFQYFMIDAEDVEVGNYNYKAISSDLAIMVYADVNDTDEEREVTLDQIYSTLKAEKLTDITNKELVYFSYFVENEKKYLFFSDIKLSQSRSDDSNVIENVNKVGFTGNAASLDRELREIIDDLTFQLAIFNVIFSIVICIIALLMTIIASRKLVDTIMNSIIKMCIKIKIAQTSQLKLKKQQELNKELEITGSFYSRDVEQIQNNENEMYQLFKVIEDLLKIFMIKNFELKESNTQDYNNAALYEYTELLDIYNETYKRISEQKNNYRQMNMVKVKFKETHRKIYNNMGCIWYTLGQYKEAIMNFDESSKAESNIENNYFDSVYTSVPEKIRVFHDRSARQLNHVRAMINQDRNDHDVSYVETHEQSDRFRSAEMELENCLKTFSSPGIATEIEILAIITSIKVKLCLDKLDSCRNELYLLERIVLHK